MSNEDGSTNTSNVYKTIPPLPVVLCCVVLCCVVLCCVVLYKVFVLLGRPSVVFS